MTFSGLAAHRFAERNLWNFVPLIEAYLPSAASQPLSAGLSRDLDLHALNVIDLETIQIEIVFEGLCDTIHIGCACHERVTANRLRCPWQFPESPRVARVLVVQPGWTPRRTAVGADTHELDIVSAGPGAS